MKNQMLAVLFVTINCRMICANPLLSRNATDYEVDGDIILYDDSEYSNDDFEDAVGLVSRLWDKINGTVRIPYTIPSEVSDYDRSQIDRAIAEFHQKTCIRFTPRKLEQDYVRIDTFNFPNYCRSTMGKKGGEQIVRAGNCKIDGVISWGRICHELMHVVGFMHEQNCNDRSDYIEIDYDAIKQVELEDFLPIGSLRKKFRKCSLTKTGQKWGCKRIGKYDGNSIFHYPNTVEHWPPPSIRALVGHQSPTKIFTAVRNCSNGECDYGQRKELSPDDVRDIELLYQCGMKYEQCRDLWQVQNTDLCEVADCNTPMARSLCFEVCRRKRESFCRKMTVNTTAANVKSLHDAIFGSYEYHSVSNNGKSIYKYIGYDDTFLHFNTNKNWAFSRHKYLNTDIAWIYNTKCTSSYPDQCSSENWLYYNSSVENTWPSLDSLTIECETSACCLELLINGTGPIKELHSNKFGTYEYHSISNGRNVYKQVNEEYYLHFQLNSQWLVSSETDIGTNTGFIHQNDFVPSCPEKSDSNGWSFWNTSSSSWEDGGVLNIDCLS